MAVINNGILGGLAGKVGPVIGSKWKGIDYVKAYVKPANPNTSAQQVQRARMSSCVQLAQSLASSIVTLFFSPFAVKMSGYNKFVKANVMHLAASTYYLTTDNVMSEGNLQSAAISAAALAAGEVTITFSTSVVGNGLATDIIDCMVINKETYQAYTNFDFSLRSDGTGTVTVTGETDATKLIAFTVAKRGTGPTFTVSNSESFQVTT